MGLEEGDGCGPWAAAARDGDRKHTKKTKKTRKPQKPTQKNKNEKAKEDKITGKELPSQHAVLLADRW
jgi:hypothetical protein